jgi:hypothetical protein
MTRDTNNGALHGREEVIEALARAIEQDPFLRATWLGPDRDVRALLANLVEMF